MFYIILCAVTVYVRSYVRYVFNISYAVSTLYVKITRLVCFCVIPDTCKISVYNGNVNFTVDKFEPSWKCIFSSFPSLCFLNIDKWSIELQIKLTSVT